MNPLSDSNSSFSIRSNLYADDKILMKAKLKGYKVSVISGLSSESFFLDYQKSRGCFSKSQALDRFVRTLKNTKKHSTQHTVELTTYNKKSAFISFELQNQDLKVNLLSIPKNQQNNGLGTLLMELVMSIAKLEAKNAITLLSAKNTTKFYIDTIGMQRKKGSSYFNTMELKTTPSNIKTATKLTSNLFFNMEPEHQISPIPYKILP